MGLLDDFRNHQGVVVFWLFALFQTCEIRRTMKVDDSMSKQVECTVVCSSGSLASY